MDTKELKDALTERTTKVVVAKKKKRGGYTVYPQVVEVISTVIPIIGECNVIVFED